MTLEDAHRQELLSHEGSRGEAPVGERFVDGCQTEMVTLRRRDQLIHPRLCLWPQESCPCWGNEIQKLLHQSKRLGGMHQIWSVIEKAEAKNTSIRVTECDV